MRLGGDDRPLPCQDEHNPRPALPSLGTLSRGPPGVTAGDGRGRGRGDTAGEGGTAEPAPGWKRGEPWHRHTVKQHPGQKTRRDRRPQQGGRTTRPEKIALSVKTETDVRARSPAQSQGLSKTPGSWKHQDEPGSERGESWSSRGDAWLSVCPRLTGGVGAGDLGSHLPPRPPGHPGPPCAAGLTGAPGLVLGTEPRGERAGGAASPPRRPCLRHPGRPRLSLSLSRKGTAGASCGHLPGASSPLSPRPQPADAWPRVPARPRQRLCL